MGRLHLGVVLLLIPGCNLVLPLGSPRPDVGTVGDGPADGPADAAADASGHDSTVPDGSADGTCIPHLLQLPTKDDDGELLWDNVGMTPVWKPAGEDANPPLNAPEALYIGHWWGGPTWGYFRFELPVDLDGTETLVAQLQLHGVCETEDWSSGPAANALDVFVEDAPDAAVVTGELDMPGTTNGRLLGKTSVRWPPTGPLLWQIGSYNTSPDLGELLTRLVENHGGLAQGAHIQLWLRGAQANVAEVGTRSFEKAKSSTEIAQLKLTVCR